MRESIQNSTYGISLELLVEFLLRTVVYTRYWGQNKVKEIIPCFGGAWILLVSAPERVNKSICKRTSEEINAYKANITGDIRILSTI